MNAPTNSILLIHPPLAKAAEPPAGITALSGYLRGHGVNCTQMDANLEAQLWLIETADNPQDTWSTRAHKHRLKNLASLRTPATYNNLDRYQRAVRDCNRVLELAGAEYPQLSLSLANYEDTGFDPLASRDLLRAAEAYQKNLFFPWFSQYLAPQIKQNEPSFIGISLSYLSQALPSFALIGFLRATFPQIALILGGGLVTSWMSNPEWSNPFSELVDHCISGPGEKPLLALLDGFEKHKNLAPDYAGLPLDYYLAPGLILPYAASRGCYWNKCSFCPEPAEQSRYRPIQVTVVMEQLQQLCTNLQPSLLHLLDNAISPALMEALCRAPLGVPWYGFVRFHEQLADPAFCKRLRISGCVLLKLGLESGSQSVLDAMHKGIDLDLVERVLESLKQAGIATYVYLLFGTPTESLDEARQTLGFTRDHHEAITFLNLAIFNMPLGSREAETLQAKPFSSGELSLYQDFEHPRGWDRRAIRSFLDREFKRAPEIKTILQRDPPYFTSNHAPFFSPFFSLESTPIRVKS